MEESNYKNDKSSHLCLIKTAVGATNCSVGHTDPVVHTLPSCTPLSVSEYCLSFTTEYVFCAVILALRRCLCSFSDYIYKVI